MGEMARVLGVSPESMTLELSVVVPLYNEAESVPHLHAAILAALSAFPQGSFELIFVDDGSTDGTFQAARALSPLKLIRFAANYGQTAAIAAGIAQAKGEIIVTLDGDLENDPADIPRLLSKLDEGYDVVSGWRQNRWRGKPFSRRLPSLFASWFISRITGVRLHDHGCTLKAYRRRFVEHLHLFGDMHRMMAAYAAASGARVAEMPVRFTERRFGRSKYGFSRTLKVLLDVFSFHFFRRYRNHPMHFFGWFGFGALLASVLSFAYMLYLKFFEAKDFIATPLPALTVFFALVGVQFILMGLLAEILIRTQHELQGSPPYVVDSVEEG